MYNTCADSEHECELGGRGGVGSSGSEWDGMDWTGLGWTGVGCGGLRWAAVGRAGCGESAGMEISPGDVFSGALLLLMALLYSTVYLYRDGISAAAIYRRMDISIWRPAAMCGCCCRFRRWPFRGIESRPRGNARLPLSRHAPTIPRLAGCGA